MISLLISPVGFREKADGIVSCPLISLSPYLSPFLNFAPLEQASADLTEAEQAYEKAYNAAALTSGSAAAGSLNTELMRSERLLTEDRGLPNRPWFEHLLYAPGFYTGYGVEDYSRG